MISPSTWAVAKLLLAVAGPLQNLVDRGGITHTFCNQQAVSILEQDGRTGEARLLRKHFIMFNRGTLWADRGWKCFAHYLDPSSGRGIGSWPDAASECETYFQRAMEWWVKGRKEVAFFFLGAAAHLVQDLCVPHHACGVPFNGHQQYETWVKENCGFFRISNGGLYQVAGSPGQWVYANARLAKNYYPRICRQEYHEVTEVLLGRAQRTTAGFIQFFCSRIM
ncbi:MAG TPA: phospholipase [Desulfotomaculum sp.]|nr:phospholipase [Desulfotomaculum sp.]